MEAGTFLLFQSWILGRNDVGVSCTGSDQRRSFSGRRRVHYREIHSGRESRAYGDGRRDPGRKNDRRNSMDCTEVPATAQIEKIITEPSECLWLQESLRNRAP